MIKNTFTEKQKWELIDALDIAKETVSMDEEYTDDTGHQMTEEELDSLQELIKKGEDIPMKYKGILEYEFQGKLNQAIDNKNSGLLPHEESERVGIVISMKNGLQKLNNIK